MRREVCLPYCFQRSPSQARAWKRTSSEALVLRSILSLLLMVVSVSASARAYEDLQKCEELRPKICGQNGAPSCADVQKKIDACKEKVREAEVKRINAEGQKTNKQGAK